jgi:hypothetical protein
VQVNTGVESAEPDAIIPKLVVAPGAIVPL